MEQGTTAKLCECGCGKPAPIARWNSKRDGYVAGQPMRFVLGHVNRGRRQERECRLFAEMGQRFGRGVVIDPEVRIPSPWNDRGIRGARLRCDCGNEYTAHLGALLGERTKSCGCLLRMTRAERLSLGETPIGRPIKDRTGQRFGKLTVLRFVDTKPGHARWLCRCDCGNETIVAVGNLLNAVGCGCGQVASRVVGRAPGETARLRVLQQYQRGAQRRGFSWDLTDEDFDRLTSMDCFYCGQPPSTVYRSGKYEGGEFVYNGLDRQDSAAGYLPANVVAACPLCNRAKSDLSYDDFTAWLARLTAHQWLNPQLMPSRLLKGGA